MASVVSKRYPTPIKLSSSSEHESCEVNEAIETVLTMMGRLEYGDLERIIDLHRHIAASPSCPHDLVVPDSEDFGSSILLGYDQEMRSYRGVPNAE